jgi:diguanylate cyclase (GGDEF)-like protein
MAVDTACTIVLCWQDLKHHHNESLYSVLLSFPLIGLFTFLALMAHVFTPGGGYTYLFSIGVFFFVIFLALSGANQLSHHLRQSASAEAYQKLAYTDVLTGLKNRMAYEEHLSKEETASGRETYVVFDVNNLKHINDTYGHQSGDTAIIQTARAIQRSFGDLGSCYRVGGDEFLAILQNTNEEEILSACRQTIETLTQFSKGNTFPVQVAIGYASSEQQGARGLALFHQADRQMYLVKQQQKEAALA